MPETIGDDQAEACNLALEKGIGCDRGAVSETGEIVDRGIAENRFDAADEPDRRILGRACHFGDAHRAGGGIHADDIGEGTAGIDTDTQLRRSPGHVYASTERASSLTLPDD